MRHHLAVTVHDPGGHFLPGLQRLRGRLASTFAGIGALVTDDTAEPVARFLTHALGARVDRAASDVGAIGRHRRRSVELALAEDDDGAVLYSDVDHVLRWIEARPDEVDAALAAAATTDMLVIGRTDAAMTRSPRRLRETENVVNHVYELMTGRRWDLMFAVRCLSPAAARVVVEKCTEATIANDVEWPLVVEAAGLDLAWFAADGLTYRVRQDFDAPADERDHDPAEWIDRIELAAGHARVLKTYLGSPP